MLFLFDLNRCTGCEACRVACALENHLPAGLVWRQVVTFNPQRRPELPVFHLSLACNHCRDAPCIRHCPARACERDPATGAVVVDPRRCIGCHYCAWACPYDAPRYDAEARVMTKCTFCRDRLAAGREPACVELCPTGALRLTAPDGGAGVGEVTGFPARPFGPGIRFVPLRDPDRRPELNSQSVSDEPEPAGALPPAKISLGSEWPLVVFSLLAAGLVAALTAAAAGAVALPPLAFLGLAALSLAVSVLHLGHKRRAPRALLNVRSSWLSREILLWSLFVGLGTGHLVLGPAVGWLGAVAAAVGFAALFAIDRVYDLVREEGGGRVHSADVLLTGALLTGILTARLPLVAGAALVKLVLYLWRKLRPGRPRQGLRPWWSALRLGFGFGLPLVALVDPARWPLWALAGSVIGEAVDRCELYAELFVPTPGREMARELAQRLRSATRVSPD